jgi:hypothetical protein
MKSMNRHMGKVTFEEPADADAGSAEASADTESRQS